MGDITLPPSVVSTLEAAASTPPSPGPGSGGQIQPTEAAGGVSAVPVDASTFIQVAVLPNPNPLYSTTTVSVSICARLMDASGNLNYSRWDNSFAVSAGITFQALLLPGYLISLAVTCNTASIPSGVLFVVGGLVHQANTGLPLDTLLLSSYVSSFAPAGWPAGALTDVSADQGAPCTIPFGASAPGAHCTLTVPDAYFLPLAAYVGFTTSVAVANREVFMYASIAGGPAVYLAICPNTQAAGLTVGYLFMPTVSPFAPPALDTQVVGLTSELLTPGGTVITIAAAAIQAADQFANGYVYGRAWL